MGTKRNGSITSESFKWNMDRSHHLCFHVLEKWAGECSHIFLHTVERLANRRKEPKSKTSAWIKAILNFALIRSMLLCLCRRRTPSNIDNISEIDLCAIINESNIEWITYKFIPCYIIIINMYGYVYIRSLFRYFLFYTQPSDDMELIFHAKLTVYFISNLYAGFILLKIECAMEYPPS